MQGSIPKSEHLQPEQPSNRCTTPTLSHLLRDRQLHNARNRLCLHDADTHLPIYTIFSQFYKSALTPNSFDIFNSGSRHLATAISSSISTALYTQNTMMEGNSILSNGECLWVDNEPIDSNTQHRGEFIDYHRSCPHRFCAISSSCGPFDRAPHVSHCSPIAPLPYLHAVMKGNAEQSAHPRRVAQRVQKHRQKLEAICDSLRVSFRTLLLCVVKIRRYAADRLLQQPGLHVLPCRAVAHFLSDLSDFGELAEKTAGRKRVGAVLEVRAPISVLEQPVHRAEMQKALENGIQIATISEIVESASGRRGCKRGIVLVNGGVCGEYHGEIELRVHEKIHFQQRFFVLRAR